MAHGLPPHLRKYIVEQNYEKYTPVDQAVWRYILRQLKSFLTKHAHESYVEGLEKTGIEIERIPRIEDISAKLEKFGWRALPVSGFIPPAAFMELQASGVLPIASDMRTVDHLLYTPAPDIVHEAAGHAPILIQPEFAQYLRDYAQVAKKALISKEDLALYEAIRILSDLKENPGSTQEQIDLAQSQLDLTASNTSHVSEAAELGRMNWWTAEYGLIGDIDNPKIFGAGLLSSVGEAQWCLSSKVAKRPLTVDCVKVGYDITEPQPQLFVTPDFKTLGNVLREFAKGMAFQVGGVQGVEKAIRAETVNTVELNSGIQISGLCKKALKSNSGEISYLQFAGPTQLCFKDKEIPGHSQKTHAEGFGTAVGLLKNNQQELSLWTEEDLSPYLGKVWKLEYQSGVCVEGTLEKSLFKESKLILLSFKNCRVTLGSQVLFDPAWGTYDLAVGSSVTSVFGGAADREAFGETDDFVAARVPLPQYSDTDLKRHRHYKVLRDLREKRIQGQELEEELLALVELHEKYFSEDWLLFLEAFELVEIRRLVSPLKNRLLQKLKNLAQNSKNKSVIEDGLNLVLQEGRP